MRRHRLSVAAIISAGFVAASLPAVGQTPQTDRTREADTRLETVREATQLRLRSIDLGVLDDGVDITYAQVLADPDNIELNVRYALTQIRNGDVLGAAATLERVLLVAPDIVEVRILYAVVLFRLDNLDEAEREMQAIMQLPLSPDLRKQIEGYLSQIEKRRKRTRFVLTVSLGYQYDWNRNAAPSSSERLAFDTPTPLTGSDTRQDDLSLNGLTRLAVEHDLGTQARHAMIGSIAYYGGDQVQQDDYDLQALFLDWGYRLDFAPLTVTPQITYKSMRLAREKYYTGYGGSLRAKYAVSSSLSLFAAEEILQQSFHNTDGTFTAPEQNGRNYKFTTGGSLVLNPKNRLQLTLEDTRNSAAKRWESYDRNGLSLSHTWLVGSGAFLLSSFTTYLDRYDGPDPFISSMTRRDNIYRLNTTFGIPLGRLGEMPEGWEDVALTVSGELYRQISTITNYTYTNYRFSVGLGKVWEF